MEENKDLIVIDPKEIELAMNEAGEFIFSADAEVHLVRLLKAQELIEKAIADTKQVLTEVMEAEGVKKIEGKEVCASFGLYGAKYVVTDPVVAVAQGYATEEEVTQVKRSTNTKAIDQYSKENSGDLPEGIAHRARSASVSIDFKSNLKKKGKADELATT